MVEAGILQGRMSGQKNTKATSVATDQLSSEYSQPCSVPDFRVKSILRADPLTPNLLPVFEAASAYMANFVEAAALLL